jgi:hypothetical protein
MVIIFILSFLFLFNSEIFCQQWVEEPPIIFPDYSIFLPNPEKDFYPSIYAWRSIIYPNHSNSTIGLTSMNIDQLITNSQFIIDTIYFENYIQKKEKFKNYRRIFNYDDKFQIVSVIAEEFFNNQWAKHQETEIFYTDKNKISEIHYLRTNTPLEEFKIVCLYDSLGYLAEEICQLKNDEKWSLNWKEKFSIISGKLSCSDIYYYEDSYRLIDRYIENDNQLFVESDYFMEDTSYNKFVYEVNDINRLLKFTYSEFKVSKWQIYESEDYIFDENDRVIRVEIIYHDRPSYHQIKYLYDENNNLITKISYIKTLENSIENLKMMSTNEYEYNAENYLLKHIFQFRQDDSLKNMDRVLFERDEFNNVIAINSDRWRNNNWERDTKTRIIYRKKKY